MSDREFAQQPQRSRFRNFRAKTIATYPYLIFFQHCNTRSELKHFLFWMFSNDLFSGVSYFLWLVTHIESKYYGSEAVLCSVLLSSSSINHDHRSEFWLSPAAAISSQYLFTSRFSQWTWARGLKNFSITSKASFCCSSVILVCASSIFLVTSETVKIPAGASEKPQDF